MTVAARPSVFLVSSDLPPLEFFSMDDGSVLTRCPACQRQQSYLDPHPPRTYVFYHDPACSAFATYREAEALRLERLRVQELAQLAKRFWHVAGVPQGGVP